MMRNYKLSYPTYVELSSTSWSVLALTRFILSAIVFIYHLQYIALMPPIFQHIMVLGGRAAVTGFLLISGFSIGHSYKKSNKGYFKRRFLRIYPLYFFAVLFTVFLQYFIGSPYYVAAPELTMKAAGWLTSVINFIFLQGFVSITLTYNPPLWSLSVEVFFYLLVPFLILLSKRIIVGILIFSMIAFAFLNLNVLFGYSALIYAWPWLLGFLISGKIELKYIMLFYILGVSIIIFNQIRMPERLSWLTFSFVVAVIIACIHCNFILRKSIITLFNYLGEISYPLYLFHWPIYLLLHYFGIRNAYFFCGLLLITIVPIDYLLDHWFKRVFWIPLVNWIEIQFNFENFILLKK